MLRATTTGRGPEQRRASASTSGPEPGGRSRRWAGEAGDAARDLLRTPSWSISAWSCCPGECASSSSPMGSAERHDPHDNAAARIRELLRASAGARAQARRRPTLASWLSNNGVKPADDVAVVVLRRLPHPREPTGAATARAPGESIAVELEPGSGVPGRCPGCALAAGVREQPRSTLSMRLLVSELVTNSVRHARLLPGDQIGLQVELSDRMFRVEVSDPGEGLSSYSPRAGSQGGPGGWGLFLTEQLADRWGVDRDGGWGPQYGWRGASDPLGPNPG